MASDKGVNEVCSLLKDVQCASHRDIIKLVKMELFFKIKKVSKGDQGFDDSRVQNSVALITTRYNHLFTSVTANKDGLAAIDRYSCNVIW